MFSAGVASEQVAQSGGRHHLEHVVRPGQRITTGLAERFDKGEHRHRDKASDGYPQRRGVLEVSTSHSRLSFGGTCMSMSVPALDEGTSLVASSGISGISGSTTASGIHDRIQSIVPNSQVQKIRPYLFLCDILI